MKKIIVQNAPNIKNQNLISENQKWQKIKREAIKKAIKICRQELKHYKHLLKKDNHTLKECPLHERNL